MVARPREPIETLSPRLVYQISSGTSIRTGEGKKIKKIKELLQDACKPVATSPEFRERVRAMMSYKVLADLTILEKPWGIIDPTNAKGAKLCNRMTRNRVLLAIMVLVLLMASVAAFSRIPQVQHAHI